MSIKNLLALALLSYCLFSFNFANAQLDQATRIKSLDALLAKDVTEKGNHIVGYLFDSLIIENQKSLSGTQLEAGKSFGSSLSITDKGATVNVFLPQFRRAKWLYKQVHISGTGKDNFISLFKDGEYGNTISGGLNFNIFSYKNYATFYPSNKRTLRYQLEMLKEDYVRIDSPTELRLGFGEDLKYYREQVNKLDTAIVRVYFINKSTIDTLGRPAKKDLLEFLKITDTLSKAGILPPKFFKAKDIGAMQQMIVELKNDWRYDKNNEGKGLIKYREKLYLQKAEVLQMAAKWNTLNFFWLSASADLNVSPYNILDRSAVAENYTKVVNDYFFSGSISLNWLNSWQKGRQFRFFISPTLKFQNARQYNEKDKMTLTRDSSYVIGTDSLIHRSMTTDVFAEKADRKNAWSFEVPMIFYWNKPNLGFEIVPKGGCNDINGDNYGVKFGFFVPIEVKEGTPVIIEPIFRLQKLFENEDAKFWKDNVVVGFNVSVSLPKGLGKIGNK